MRATLALAAITLCIIIALRLYGTGCDNRPFGFTLAIEESDIDTHCATIQRLPWATE